MEIRILTIDTIVIFNIMYLFISPLCPGVPREVECKTEKAEYEDCPEQSVCNPEAPVKDIGNPMD